MKQPTVSIVIVNWKTPRLLSGCLRSLAQSPRHKEFEILVVDNNSGDGSVEMLEREFPYVRVVANKENVGFGRACNQVIPEAQGRYVVLLNPDTIVVDDAIGVLADYMDSHDDCGAVGPKILNPDGSLQLSCRRSFPTPAAAFYRFTYLSLLFPKNKTFSRYNLSHADPDEEMEVEALSGSCMMVRKSAIDQIGLLDEAIFMFGEDIDWSWRFAEAGWSVHYYPKSVVYHYHGASSRFRRVGATIDLHKGMEIFYRKHLARKYPAPFNWFVYTAIWLRAAAVIMLTWVVSVTPRKSGVFRDALEPVELPNAPERETVGTGR